MGCGWYCDRVCTVFETIKTGIEELRSSSWLRDFPTWSQPIPLKLTMEVKKKMKKFLKWLAPLMLMFCIGLATNAYAVVGHQENISVGTSTTVSSGSSTVLALSQYNRTLEMRNGSYVDPGNFSAYLQYSNPSNTGVVARYTLDASSPTVTSGFTIKDRDAIVLQSVTDMKNFRVCAGTTTTNSYGTITAIYCYSPVSGTSPKLIISSGN